MSCCIGVGGCNANSMDAAFWRKEARCVEFDGRG
jgi:hypothetical protein